jgi:hypothetical protein
MDAMTLVAAAVLALGKPGPRRRIRPAFAETDRAEPTGLECRDGSAGGFRGLWAIRAQAADLNNRISRKRT